MTIKGKSTFYPVESQGHLLKTFLEFVQEDFREIGATKDLKHMKKNLTREEEKALKNLSENKQSAVQQIKRGEL